MATKEWGCGDDHLMENKGPPNGLVHYSREVPGVTKFIVFKKKLFHFIFTISVVDRFSELRYI